MTGVVRTDDMVSVGMISATFDEVELNSVHGYLMSRVVRAGYSLLKGTQSHFAASFFSGNFNNLTVTWFKGKVFQIQRKYNLI